jgi:Zn-dependent M16 (insulinase) family peptidase
MFLNFLDLSVLPTLELVDIPRSVKPSRFLEDDIKGYPVQWLRTGTNEITYLRILCHATGLDESLLPYLSLYTAALTSLGTKSLSAAEFDERIRLYTGGIGASTTIIPQYSSIEFLQQGIVFSGSALDRNLPKMYDLLALTINETNFDDVEKLKTLVLTVCPRSHNFVFSLLECVVND